MNQENQAKTVSEGPLPSPIKMEHLQQRTGVIQFAKEQFTKFGLYTAICAITGRAIPVFIMTHERHADYVCLSPWFEPVAPNAQIPYYQVDIKETNRILNEPVYEVTFVKTEKLSPYRQSIF